MSFNCTKCQEYDNKNIQLTHAVCKAGLCMTCMHSWHNNCPRFKKKQSEDENE